MTSARLPIPSFILTAIGLILCIPVFIFYIYGEYFRKRSPFAQNIESEREHVREERNLAIELHGRPNSPRATPRASRANSLRGTPLAGRSRANSLSAFPGFLTASRAATPVASPTGSPAQSRRNSMERVHPAFRDSIAVLHDRRAVGKNAVSPIASATPSLFGPASPTSPIGSLHITKKGMGADGRLGETRIIDDETGEEIDVGSPTSERKGTSFAEPSTPTGLDRGQSQAEILAARRHTMMLLGGKLGLLPEGDRSAAGAAR
jgi:hypothetical protein